MNDIKKITGYNLLIMLGYLFIFASLDALPFSFFMMVLHFLITGIIAMVYFSKGNHSLGKAYILTSGILLLIGTFTCGSFLNGAFY